MNVVIIDYGAGNLFSVKSSLNRLGINAVVSSDPRIIQNADKVIFPGVGEAGSAMSVLKKSGIDIIIPKLKMPVLGICLGMQLMCRSSEEGNVSGLNIFDIDVKKFKVDEKLQNVREALNNIKIPHMGWNNVYDFSSTLLENINERERFYFVHSYYVPRCDYTIALCDYICEFSAVIRKQNFYGCQFHPEKSGKKGALLLKAFCELT